MSGSSGGSYLRDLNALPSTDIEDADAFNPDDLAIFTNTRFFDFDMGPEERRGGRRGGNRIVEEVRDDDTRTDLTEGGELIDPSLKSGSMGFLNDFDPYGYDTYPFGDLPPTSTHQPTPSSPTVSANIDRSFTAGMVPPDGSHHHHHPAPHPAPPAPLSESSSPGQSPYPIAPSPSRGMRARKASTASSSEHIQSPSSEQFSFGGDESGSGSRAGAAVDEDKRRRNTAASARFRVKKKEKEAQLAKDAKDAAEKVKLMEAKIKKLEEQNEWLKSLLLEKKRALPKVQEATKDGVASKEKDN